MLNTQSQAPNPPSALVALPSRLPSSDPVANAERAIAIDDLAIIFETFLEQVFPCQGFILLDPHGRHLQSSPTAKRLCEVLKQDTPIGPPAAHASASSLPHGVKTLIQYLIESRKLFPDQPIQLQDEVVLEETTRIQIQGRWIHFDAHRRSHIIVTLEDLTEMARRRAAFDARQYGFTPREREVWALYLQGFSYHQIGHRLYIAINTVKKHMKNVHRKRKCDLF